MTDDLRRSILSGNGSPQNMPQGMAEVYDQTAADSLVRQPNLDLELQALQILDSIDDCIKVLDLEGRILFINQRGQSLLGIEDITSVLNTAWIEFWQGEDRQAASQAIAQARSGEVCTFQGYRPTPGSEPKWWECKVSPMRGANGQIERLLCVSRDITQRRQIEDERKQAEEKLRESEERYRAIVNQAVTGVACTDLDGNLMLVNQKYCDITGYSADELKQRQMQDITHPEDLPRNVELFHRMRTEGTPFEIEKRYIRKDGSIVWVNNSVSVIRDRAGKPQSAVAIVLDITERKQAALSAEFLATVTQDLAEASSVEEIIQTLGEQLNRYLQASVCAFVEISKSAEVATIHHSWHQREVPSLVGDYHLAEFVTDEFFQTAKAGRTIIVRDVTTDPQIADPERFSFLKIGSFINVPLIRDHEWKFTLGIYHQTPYNWRSNEIELMRELANRIWTKLERTRVEIALRQSQELFSALVSDAPFGVYMIDAEFRIQQANQTAVRAFNIQPLIGRDLAEALRIIWQEPFATEAINRFRHTLATGESFYSPPIVEPRADIAEIQSYDWQIHRITLSDNSYGVVCYFYDLSELKRAEEMMRRTADRDAFLVTLNDALRPLNDPSEILTTANRVLGEQLGANRVTYFEVRGADYFLEQNYVNGAESLRGGYPIESFGAALLATYRRGQTATATDVTIDPNLSAAQRSAYANTQIAAYIGVPLVKEGEFVAGLAVHSASPRHWTPEEIALTADVAERTWAAVERARAEAALRESEAKYRSLFESIDAGFCLIEVLFDEAGQAFDYRFLEANPAFEKHTGLVDVIGKTVRELVPQHETYWFEIYGRIALTGVPERFENAAEGLERFYDVYAFRMGEPHERKVAILFNDINDRKRAEQELRESEEWARIAIQVARLGGWRLHLDTNLIEMDERMREIWGEPKDSAMVPLPQVMERIHPDDRDRVANAVNAAINFRSTGTYEIEYRIVWNDSTERWVFAKGQAQFEGEGESRRTVDFFGTLLDVTDRKQIEVERERLLQREQAAREQAEQANRIKDEFLAVLSHELRSPLNPILGWAKLLQNGKLDATKTAQALATIERNAKLQSELIEDLLDVSRILRGKLKLNVAPVNLALKIRGAMETVQLAAEAKSIQITASIAEDVGLVWGDSTRLQQVIWNLLSNAVKFTPEGGHVEVKLERVDEWIDRRGDENGPPSPPLTSTRLPIYPYAQITVSDTGQGIKPDFLPFVFDYFRQADGTTTRKFGGLGLGLAIVRHLVELHGGTVRADSLGEGQGATFTIRLPIMHTPSQTKQNERSQQQSLDLSGIKILVVDDEPDTRELVAFILEQQGAQVTTATSAYEALLILPQVKPDVLLSDIGMPEMDGYMLIQQVRALTPEQGGGIPAIALTAYAGDTNQQQVLAAGFQKHISKPIEPEALVQAIVQLGSLIK